MLKPKLGRQQLYPPPQQWAGETWGPGFSGYPVVTSSWRRPAAF